MTKPIIGLCGAGPGCGKDTAGQALAALGWQKVSLADPLREILALVYGLDLARLNEQTYKETPHPNLYGMTPRRALQLIGTEGFRLLIGDATWTDCAERRIRQKLADGAPGCYVADVRFPDELRAVKRWGGRVVYIDRPGLTVEASVAGHASERHVGWLREHADAVIVNDGTPAQLQARLLDILSRH